MPNAPGGERQSGGFWMCARKSYPTALNEEEVARAGYEANAGGFSNALGRPRTLQGRAELRSSGNLFDAETG